MFKNKNKACMTIAILCFFFVCGHYSAINSVIQKMIEAYPDTPVSTVRLVSTLPSLIGLFTGLYFGTIAGKKLKWKTLMLLDLGLISVGGLLPVWWNANFTYVLIARCILGVGVGFSMCRNAIIVSTYTGKERASMLGFGILSLNIGNALGTAITGALGDISWNMAFYVYLIALCMFFVVLFLMKEPETVEAAAPAADAGKVAPVQEEVTKVSPKAYLYPFMIMFAILLWYPFMVGISTFLTAKGIGSAAVAGSVISVCTVGGAVSGAVFGFLNKLLKRWMLPVCWALMAIGQALVLFAGSIPVVSVGAFLLGFGCVCLTPVLTNYMPYDVPKSKQAFFATLIYASSQIGVFFSTYWINFINKLLSGVMDNDIANTFLATVVISAVMAIIFAIYDVRAKALKEEMSKSK